MPTRLADFSARTTTPAGTGVDPHAREEPAPQVHPVRVYRYFCVLYSALFFESVPLQPPQSAKTTEMFPKRNATNATKPDIRFIVIPFFAK
jgi:hypothetical protein